MWGSHHQRKKGIAMSRPYDVMIAGHLCIDIIPIIPDTGASQISEIMRPGKLINVKGCYRLEGLNIRVGFQVCESLGHIVADFRTSRFFILQ